MTHATAEQAQSNATTERATAGSRPRELADAKTASNRLIAFGGLGFAVLVIIENILRGGTAPEFGASSDEILAYADETSLLVLLGLLPVGVVLLTAFAAGLFTRLRAVDPSGPWAVVGLIGVVMIAGLFFVASGFLAVLVANRDQLVAEPVLTEVLWAAHGAVFAMNLAAIGLALFGFSAGAWRAGLLPSWMAGIGAVGALALAVSSAGASAIAQGSSLIFVGFAGFVAWVLLLLVAGIAALRDPSV